VVVDVSIVVVSVVDNSVADFSVVDVAVADVSVTDVSVVVWLTTSEDTAAPRLLSPGLPPSVSRLQYQDVVDPRQV
jgi:hypothetical protein